MGCVPNGIWRKVNGMNGETWVKEKYIIIIIYMIISAAGCQVAHAGTETAGVAEKPEHAAESASETAWYQRWNVASLTNGWETSPTSSSTISLWGERIASWALPVKEEISSGAGSLQDWASRTWQDLGDSVRNGRCVECGAPTLLDRERCFHCLQRAKSEEFLNWMDESGRSARDMLQNLRDPKLTKPVIDRLIQARDYFRSRRKHDPAIAREQHRQMLELLGRMKIVNDGRTLNEIAKDTLKKYAPALEGTDYIQDPARAISYFLILDAKGFIEKVRCVKMKDGRVLTLIEAYQEYTHTDPAKAKDMLEIIEDIRQISSPLETDENRIPAALDALSRILRLISK